MSLAPLTGSWLLLAAYLGLPGGERVNYFGPNPTGRMILDPGGTMIVLLTRAERSGDPDALFGSMLAYTGRFVADATSFVTHVNAAWVPAWVGTAQTRHYSIDGDRLTIRTPPGPHPAHPGGEVSAVLEWVREG